MARITKADLEQQVNELNKQINEYIIQLVQKDSEIFNLKEIHDKNYSETTLYIEQEKKIKDLELEIKYHKDTINTLNNTIKVRNNTIETLQNTIEQLKDEIHQLKDENIQKIKNERGAGRKSRFTEQEKESIRTHRLEGKTINEIAKMFNCSAGLIHKLINEKK